MIKRAERVPNVPKHHNMWEVTYDCGHVDHVCFKSPDPDPYDGGPGVHKDCPNDKVAAVAPASSPTVFLQAPSSTTAVSIEASARSELLNVAKTLALLAKERLSEAKSIQIETHCYARSVASPSVLMQQISEWTGARPKDASPVVFHFYYLGPTGELLEQISQPCFYGYANDEFQLPGYYLVEASEDNKLLQSWTAVVRDGETVIGHSAAETKEAHAVSLATAAAACLTATMKL